MARLWHTAILSKWKPIFEYIPIESQIEKFQNDYYDAIARCHVTGNSTYFIEFMLSQIDKILDELSAQITEDNEQLSETIKKLLDVMEYDIPYTSSSLMEKLELKSREGFRRNYLHPALELNLIRMTTYRTNQTAETSAMSNFRHNLITPYNRISIVRRYNYH